ncbi:MAG: hypothetical protein AAGF35_15350, partial [Pseudomonadota bacterium]
MVTPIMLNCKEKLPELTRFERSPHCFVASVLLGLVLSLSTQPANAELVLGASLEDRFEDTTEDA